MECYSRRKMDYVKQHYEKVYRKYLRSGQKTVGDVVLRILGATNDELEELDTLRSPIDIVNAQVVVYGYLIRVDEGLPILPITAPIRQGTVQLTKRKQARGSNDTSGDEEATELYGWV